MDENLNDEQLPLSSTVKENLGSEKINVPTLQFELDKSKNFNEQAKDIVGAMATAKAIEDDKLVKNVTEAKKDELTSKAEADAKVEKAKNKEAEKTLQDKTFGIYQGVASYIGLKRPLPEKMLKYLMCLIQPIVGIFIVMIGVPIAIISIIMDGINVLAEKFATISESAKRIVKALWIVILVAIGLVIINLILIRFFNYSLW